MSKLKEKINAILSYDKITLEVFSAKYNLNLKELEDTLNEKKDISANLLHKLCEATNFSSSYILENEAKNLNDRKNVEMIEYFSKNDDGINFLNNHKNKLSEIGVEISLQNLFDIFKSSKQSRILEKIDYETASGYHLLKHDNYKLYKYICGVAGLKVNSFGDFNGKLQERRSHSNYETWSDINAKMDYFIGKSLFDKNFIKLVNKDANVSEVLKLINQGKIEWDDKNILDLLDKGALITQTDTIGDGEYARTWEVPNMLQTKLLREYVERNLKLK